MLSQFLVTPQIPASGATWRMILAEDHEGAVREFASFGVPLAERKLIHVKADTKRRDEEIRSFWVQWSDLDRCFRLEPVEPEIVAEPVPEPAAASTGCTRWELARAEVDARDNEPGYSSDWPEGRCDVGPLLEMLADGWEPFSTCSGWSAPRGPEWQPEAVNWVYLRRIGVRLQPAPKAITVQPAAPGARLFVVEPEGFGDATLWKATSPEGAVHMAVLNYYADAVLPLVVGVAEAVNGEPGVKGGDRFRVEPGTQLNPLTLIWLPKGT